MKIFKTLVTFFVFVILLLIISAALIIYFAKFGGDSDLSESLKKRVLDYPQLVELVNLNQPGDFKYIYSSKKNSEILVNVYFEKGNEPNMEIEDWMSEIISETVGKKINFKIFTLSNQEISMDYTDESLNSVRDSLALSVAESPLLNIVYLPRYAENPGYTGIVLHRDTIFIFKKTIQELGSDDSTDANLEKSTIMHEWGHLLGMDHNFGDDCIMNEKVEVYDNPSIFHQVSTDYCFEETEYFRNLRLNTI